MHETASRTEPASFKAQCENLRNFLQSAVKEFRTGEDGAGIENLLSAAAELENLVETDQNSPQPKIELTRLFPIVRRLKVYLINQDIAGLADLLEDTFFPLTEEWLKESESA